MTKVIEWFIHLGGQNRQATCEQLFICVFVITVFMVVCMTTPIRPLFYTLQAL